jgi:hypothetical protein
VIRTVVILTSTVPGSCVHGTDTGRSFKLHESCTKHCKYSREQEWNKSDARTQQCAVDPSRLCAGASRNLSSGTRRNQSIRRCGGIWSPRQWAQKLSSSGNCLLCGGAPCSPLIAAQDFGPHCASRLDDDLISIGAFPNYILGVVSRHSSPASYLSALFPSSSPFP